MAPTVLAAGQHGARKSKDGSTRHADRSISIVSREYWTDHQALAKAVTTASLGGTAALETEEKE